MRRRATRLAIVLVVIAAAAACAARTPRIGELKLNPGRYYDRRVSVEGVVTTSWGIPLVPFRFYRVDDGTGEITVLSRSGRTPVRGARVRVAGRINEVAVIGGQSLGLHLNEEHLRLLRR